MAKMQSDSMNVTLMNFSQAVSDVLKEIETETYESIDKGLDLAMNHMRDKLIAETPDGKTHSTKQSWKVDGKYKNVRYINNTRTTGERIVKSDGRRTGDAGDIVNIPVVNLLEYGKKGKPFVRKTVQAEQENIINIIKREVENGSTKQ